MTGGPKILWNSPGISGTTFDYRLQSAVSSEEPEMKESMTNTEHLGFQVIDVSQIWWVCSWLGMEAWFLQLCGETSGLFAVFVGEHSD